MTNGWRRRLTARLSRGYGPTEKAFEFCLNLLRQRRTKMTSATTATMMKMLDTLPEALQDRALEHLREYIEDIREEMQWNESFSKSQRKGCT
jgi:DNA-binding transcriptional regulator GbsR (MarR family)